MAESAPIDFPILKLINDARSTYGLRHQDYDRYQAHCSTKVHHLRKSLGLTQVAGKAKKYTKKDVTPEVVTGSKYLQIVLFDTERAWAQSQLIQSRLNQSDTPASAKHHLSKRLSRAISRAAHLVELVNALASRISATQRAQTIAYHLVLQGQLAFQGQKHEKSVKVLSVAWSLLEDLAKYSTTANEEALTNEMIDDVEPMLRYCAYSLQIDTSQGVGPIAQRTATPAAKNELVLAYETLINELEKEAGQSEREKIDVTWRGKKIECRTAELVDAMLKVQSAIKSLQTDSEKGKRKKNKGAASGAASGKGKDVMGARRMGTYDKALLVLSDAETVARQAVEDNKIALSKAHSARFEASSAPLHLAHSYTIYQLLSIRTKRDLLLIEETSSKLASREHKIREKEADFIARTGARDEKKAGQKVRKRRAKVYPGLVKVYDGIVHSLEQIRDIEEVEQNGELSAKVEARIAFVRASRCMYLSRTYALVEQFPSALSLNARAKLYARQSRSTMSSLEADEDEFVDEVDFAGELLPLNKAAFDALDISLDGDYVRFSKDWFNATGGKVSDLDPDDLPVEELSLSASDGAIRVAATRTTVNKAKKPAFYDVAFNYIGAFDMDEIARGAGLRGPIEQTVKLTPSVEAMDEDVEDEEEEEEEEESKQPAEAKKGGWGFGLFGRR